MQGVAAAIDEPIAGGRHKVFGNHALAVIPQTSTIASHLPRAMGVAIAIDRARKLGVECSWPADAVVVCSFGDASLNHATAQAALNTTAHAAHQHLPVPLLFVCEDNGIGISVPSPAGWVASALSSRAALRYETADGDDPAAALAAARALADWVRETRRPAVLHLRTVRYLGHAGADVEAAYRTPAAVRADLERDPLLATARWLVAMGLRTGAELASDYLEARERVREVALAAARRPQLESAAEVMRPLAPRSPAEVAKLARADAASEEPATEPLTLALAINGALAAALDAHPEVLLFGEDIAAKGGVYGVTRGLHARFGAGRVFDTLLDETSILGLALGSAVSGFVPVPEIQYLAYLHNAEDQLRGEAATLQFFSQGQYRNGMVVRIAGLRLPEGLRRALPQRRLGRGAARHSGARDRVAGPSGRCRRDAAHLRRRREGRRQRVRVPRADRAVPHPRPVRGGRRPLARDAVAEPRAARLGPHLRRRPRPDDPHLGQRPADVAARRPPPGASSGIEARVVDLRWLAPLPIEDIAREAVATQRVLVVDETRRTGGVSEGIIATLIDVGFDGQLARVTSKDSFIPLGDAANLVLLSEDEIEAAALALV